MQMKPQLKFALVERLLENQPTEYELVSPRRNSALEPTVSQSLLTDLAALKAWAAEHLPEGSWEMSGTRVDTFPLLINPTVVEAGTTPESIQINVTFLVKGTAAKEAFERSFVKIVE